MLPRLTNGAAQRRVDSGLKMLVFLWYLTVPLTHRSGGLFVKFILYLFFIFAELTRHFEIKVTTVFTVFLESPLFFFTFLQRHEKNLTFSL